MVHSCAIEQFSRCLQDVEAWMSASRLRLNPSMTVVLWLGSRHIIDKLDVHEVQVLSSTVKVDSSARDLGVVVDRRLTMSDHVVSVCRSAYYCLRQIRPVVQSLTVNAAKTLVQACIASRLDYCNAVLHGITDNLLQRLQYVHNAAARLVTLTGRCEHITQSVLRELHWLPVLPVRRRVEFNIATPVFKALNGLAPPYLVDDCNLVSNDIRRLCSAVSFTRAVPRTRTRLGDRSFAVAGPRVWNCLPAALRAVEDYVYERFKKLLKHVCSILRRLVTFCF